MAIWNWIFFGIALNHCQILRLKWVLIIAARVNRLSNFPRHTFLTYLLLYSFLKNLIIPYMMLKKLQAFEIMTRSWKGGVQLDLTSSWDKSQVISNNATNKWLLWTVKKITLFKWTHESLPPAWVLINQNL